MVVPLTDTNRFFSREKYGQWCDNQPRGRFERLDGRIVAMAPTRGAHIRMKSAVFLALRRAVREAGVACQALPDGATVETGDSDYEPNAIVPQWPTMPSRHRTPSSSWQYFRPAPRR